MKRISLGLLTLVSSLAFADGPKRLDWDAALRGDHRSESNRGRDQYRHPRETLEFFGLSAEMTVLEVSPGGGWYTEVLAPLLKDHGQLVAGHGAPNGSAYGRRSLGGYLQKLGRAHDVYSAVDVKVMQPPAMPLDVEAGSLDMAVVFRINLRGSCLGVMIALWSLKGCYSAGRVVDIAVIGAGIGGLSSAAILNSLYGMQTEVFESGLGLV